MGILEETVIKAKDVINAAAKKTGEVISIQKLKLNIAEINSQISKDYETLGRMYFSMIDDDTDTPDEVKAIIEDIKIRAEQINALEADIASQSNSKICPACGAKNNVASFFCSKCGTKLDGE